MGLEVKVLDLGDFVVDAGVLVLGHDAGRPAPIPTFGFLITGGDAPIVVDTGFSRPEVMKERLGMDAWCRGDQGLEPQLAKHGLTVEDIGMVLLTHLHIDHSGKVDRFPMTTPVVANRREMEHSVSGLSMMGPMYPADAIKHLVDRLHTRNALRLLDLEITGPVQVAPGVWCDVAGGHTEGSMNVLVDTDEGRVVICGDVLQSIHHQLIEPHLQTMYMDAAPIGLSHNSKRQEKAAMAKALNSGRFVLPGHDRGAVVEGGRVVGRVFDSVPGPTIANEEFPGALTSDFEQRTPTGVSLG